MVTGDNRGPNPHESSGFQVSELHKYRAAFEQSRDGILFHDREGFLDANPAALALFRASSVEALLECQPADLFPACLPSGQPSHETVQARIEAAYREGKAFFEWQSRTLEGAEFPSEMLLNRVDLPGGPILETVVRDITERKAAEWASRQRADKVALVQAISTRLIGAPLEAMDPAIEEALARIGAAAEADQCQLFRLFEAGQVISNTHEWHAEGRAPLAPIQERQGLPSAHFPWLMDWLGANEVVQIGALEEISDPDFRGVLAGEGIRSILFVPLWLEDAPAGFLGLATVGRERTWPASDQHLLRLSADTLSSALNRWDLEAELRYKAYHDPLTSLFNRMALQETLSRELARSRRYGTPLSLLMLDLDYFKAINDRHGHETGDQVLEQVTRLVQEALRDFDVVGRWGGEEFIALLPETDEEAARVAAERLRKRIAEAHFQGPGQVTISLGVATTAGGENQDQLLRRLDEALYRAKEGGRNRVEQAPT